MAVPLGMGGALFSGASSQASKFTQVRRGDAALTSVPGRRRQLAMLQHHACRSLLFVAQRRPTINRRWARVLSSTVRSVVTLFPAVSGRSRAIARCVLFLGACGEWVIGETRISRIKRPSKGRSRIEIGSSRHWPGLAPRRSRTYPSFSPAERPRRRFTLIVFPDGSVAIGRSPDLREMVCRMP